MATAVANAVGTQKQFRKQPQAVYQTNVKNPSFGSTITRGANLEAEQLASSLGVLGKALWKERVAHHEREMNQFTLEEGLRWVAGKTPEDLAAFDRMEALQHSSSNFNLTDNKYAMAVLERAMGIQAASNYKQQYLKEAEGKVPKSVEDAVSTFTEGFQESLKGYNENISNKEAFNAGVHETFFKDVLIVANDAREAIDKDRRATGLRCMNTRVQDLLANSSLINEADFKSSIEAYAREIQIYCKNPAEAATFWIEVLDQNKDLLKDPKIIDTLRPVKFFGEHAIGEEIPLGKYYKIAMDNTISETAQGIIKEATNPDGSINLAKARELVDKNVEEKQKAEQPPIPQGTLNFGNKKDAVDRLRPEWKEAFSGIAGILENQGITNAVVTSATREAGQAGNAGSRSYHVDHGKGGDALDIDIGQGIYTREQGEEIVKTFKPYFKEVLWEMKGDPTGATGDHIHLGGYLGGLEPKPQAIAYNPEYSEKLRKQVEQDAADVNRVLRDKWETNKNNLLVSLYNTDNFAERRKLIKEADLPEHIKVAFNEQLDTEIRLEQKKQAEEYSGTLSPTDAFWYKYGKNNFKKDELEYHRLMHKRDQGEEWTTKEEENLDALLWRMDGYLSWCSAQGWFKGEKYQSRHGFEAGVYVGGTNSKDEVAALQGFINERKAAGATSTQIEEELRTLLSEDGRDIEDVKAQLVF